MNIALFLDCWPPMKNGVITSVQQLRAALESRGHHIVVVTVLSPGADQSDPGVLLIPQIEFDLGTKQGYGLALPIRRRILAFLKEHRIELIHTHTEFGIGFAGRWAAKRLHVPRVTTTHTMWEQYSNYMFILEFKSLFRALYRFFVKGSQVLVAPSLKAQKYDELVVPGTPIQIVPNGIDTSRFLRDPLGDHARAALRARYGMEAGDRVLVMVGRLGPEKRVEELLAALAPLLLRRRELRLVYVGDGPSLTALKAESYSSGISNQVVFTGFVEWSEVFSLYSIADIFVTASLSEVHSMTLIEAAMCGLPIVARRDDSNVDLVIDGSNGWLVDSEEALGEKVESLLNRPDDLLAFSEAARRISERFTARRHAERMERLYRILIDSYPGRLECLWDRNLLD